MSSLREALEVVYDQHGYLTPALVVEAARPKSSPLHNFVFNKNQKEAAEAWYNSRARKLIQRFGISYREADEGESVGIRKYHAVSEADDNEYVYRSAEDVVADPILTGIVLRDMEREWKALKRRYGNFVEFVEMVRRDLGDEAA